MTVSIISCELDRSTPKLSTLKTDRVNGTAGTYTLKYNIMMASVAGPINVLTAALAGSPHPVPSLWATYSYGGDTDSKSYAKSFQVDRDPKHNARYYVTVEYEPLEPGEAIESTGAPVNAEPNPLLRKPVFWWDRTVHSDLDIHDHSGVVIRNAANDLYQELVEHDRTKGVLVAEFNVATTGDFIDLQRTYENHVNAGSWTIRGRALPARTVLCREVACSPAKVETTFIYFRVSMRFAFTESGFTWDVNRAEMGQAYYTKDSGGAYVMDGDNRKRTDVGSVVPLNLDGTRRDDGEPVLITSWRVKSEADYGALPFSTA